MLPFQCAYRTGISTGDIVLAHKYLLAGSSTKKNQKICAGIDLSTAFDTVDRKKLIDILRRGTEEENFAVIKRLLSQTTMRAKNGKTIEGRVQHQHKGPTRGWAITQTFYLISGRSSRRN